LIKNKIKKSTLYLFFFTLTIFNGIDVSSTEYIAENWVEQSISTISTSVSIHDFSVDFDNNNFPHIAFASKENNSYVLKYKYIKDYKWVEEKVCDLVSYTSDVFILANSNNSPNIIFGDDDSIKYAYYEGSNFSVKVITSGYLLSAAIDSKDNLHFLYKQGHTDPSFFKYAKLDTSDLYVLNLSTGCWPASLILDKNDNPHTAYNISGSSIAYIYWTGSQWQTDVAIEDWSGDPVLLLDQAGNPYIIYEEEKAIKFAKRNGIDWSTSTIVDTGYYYYWSLLFSGVIDNTGKIHIAYWEVVSSNKMVSYAKWDGVSWSTKTVIIENPPAVVSVFTVVDNENNVYLFYSYYHETYEGDYVELKYVYYDDVPPSSITDLKVSCSIPGEIKLSWTSPEDDKDFLKCNFYVLKYSTIPISNETDFINATTYYQTWSPEIPGTTEQKTITDLTSGLTYYFAIKAVDFANNISTISNIAYCYLKSTIVTHYEIIVPTEVVSGQNFTVTINAKNNTNDTIPSISGSLTLQAVLAGNESYTGTGVLGITSADLSNGTVTISYQTYSKAEDIKIKVIDENNITGISNTISVTAGVSSNLDVTANPSSIISGQSALITAAITDIYDNPVTNKIVNFEIIKGSGSLSSSSAITDSNGEATVTFTQDLGKAEVNTIRVSAGSLSKDIDIKVAVLVVADSGGTIVASEDPNTKVTIPPNVINTDLQIFIRLTNDLTDEEKQKIATANNKLTRGQIISSIVRAFNAMKNDGTEYSSFSDFITVEIPYLDNDDDDIMGNSCRWRD